MAPAKVNPPAEWLHAHKWKIFGVMMIGWAMSLIDVSIVNITIPELQRDLDASVSTVSWVINAYNLAFAVLLVSMGRLADQFGRKRFFMIGLAIFTIGSAACAASWDIYALIGFRVLQGIGAGTLAPLGFAMTVLVFPPQHRGRGLALIAVIALVSTAIGPTLGGVIVDLLNWHWIFIINIPFGILGLILCRQWWPETYDLTAGRRVDWLGMSLLGLSVFCLVFALVESSSMGWGNPIILFLAQMGILFGIGFALSQRFGKRAMITPELTRNKQFVNANLAMILFGAGALAANFLLVLVFVDLWGYTPLEGALALTPVPACGLLAWPFVGRAADKRSPGQMAAPALLIMAVGLLWVSFIPMVSNYWIIFPGLILIGVGMGTVFPAINVGAMGAVQGPQLGLASGILNTARQLGAAVGIAFAVSVFATASGLSMWIFEDDFKDTTKEQGVPPAMAQFLVHRTLSDYAGGATHRFEIDPGYDQTVARYTLGAARDGYAWSLRLAALCVLGAIPLARTMRRHPGQHRKAAPAAATAAAGGPPAPAPTPVRAAADQS
jgi:EmrB/QacA subfamily drug resistance transporter